MSLLGRSWAAGRGADDLHGVGPVVSSCPAGADRGPLVLLSGVRPAWAAWADLGSVGRWSFSGRGLGRSWASGASGAVGAVIAGEPGRGRAVSGWFAGGRGGGFPGAHFTPLLIFPGPTYTPPCIFPELLLRISIFSGGICSPAHFRIFSHFRIISSLFAFFLRYSQK